ncbi:MAG: hypothetical protein KDB07_11185, partial [Planctomycetes bacterium]|nr:hypothetical protein [Planctomycetota bacterium]
AHYAQPENALEAAQNALSEDKKLSFISTMSRETLDEHAQKIEFGWTEIREHFAFLKSDMHVVEDELFVPVWSSERPEDVDRNFVWPDQDNAKAVRRVRVAFSYDGEDFEEDLLFVQEVDEQDANAEDSPWIRIGEQWYLRERHPNPERYRDLGRSLEERTNWRLVYPYYPFHQESKIAVKIVEALSKKG